MLPLSPTVFSLLVAAGSPVQGQLKALASCRSRHIQEKAMHKEHEDNRVRLHTIHDSRAAIAILVNAAVRCIHQSAPLQPPFSSMTRHKIASFAIEYISQPQAQSLDDCATRLQFQIAAPSGLSINPTIVAMHDHAQKCNSKTRHCHCSYPVQHTRIPTTTHVARVSNPQHSHPPPPATPPSTITPPLPTSKPPSPRLHDNGPAPPRRSN